jgi:DNA-binding transcriptional LysR family regulator
LEAAVGVRLVNRSQAGSELEPQATRLIRLAEDLEHGLDATRRDQRTLGGTIKISVPDGMVQAAAQALLAMRRENPEIDIELWGDNRMADIAKREADIGVRLTRSTSNVLVEKQVATLRFGLYASADYVRRYLPSARLRRGEAERHAFIGLDARWKHLPHEQWMISLGAVRFPFRSTSIVAILEAVRQGVGIAALVEQDARNEGLVRIDVHSPGPTQALFLVYHHELRKAPHIRAAVAAIEAFIRQQV